jgi:hypothetical protein
MQLLALGLQKVPLQQQLFVDFHLKVILLLKKRWGSNIKIFFNLFACFATFFKLNIPFEESGFLK